jgi:polyisoprenoid-binding protein YceI
MIGPGIRLSVLALLLPGLAVAQARSGASRKAAIPTRRSPKLAPAPSRFTLAASGNQARFIVREHLMIMDAPNDAIGVTRAISGGIALTADGRIDPANSRIVVDLTTLTSDKENRDTWIKSHTLKTDSFPNAVFVPRQFSGAGTLPLTGTIAVKLVGDLTVHGVTRPATWDVTLTAHGDEYTGSASTHIKFEDFGMDQPRLMIVISVVDDVKLEYDFHFLKADPK